MIEIPLDCGKLCFAQVVAFPLIVFFDLRVEARPSLREILDSNVAFSLWVAKSALVDQAWTVIGRSPIPETVDRRPAFFKLDRISGKYFLTYSGEEEIPVSAAQLADVECAAVWELEHLLDRLQDHFAGRPNRWVEAMRPKLEG